MPSGSGRQQWTLIDTSPLRRLPRPVYFRAYHIAAGTCVRAHKHAWWQFLFARDGLMQVQAGDINFTLPPDYGMWIPPRCAHTLWVGEDVALESLYIERDAIALLPDTGVRVVMVDEFVRAFLHHGCTAIPTRYDPAGPDARKVAVLLDLVQALPDAPFQLPFPAEPRLLQVCLAIQADPHLPHTLADACALALMSSRSFSRHFVKATGMPYHAWRQRMRLLASLEMLRRGASVTDVALTIGYATPSAFIYAFKQLFGTSPSRFTSVAR
ncbi:MULTISPECIES: helix-turn-helix transcriptional regulator [Pandoraea]|uniref:AraC family transcriptional regulator n=1 Tax=Pandoraea TaxID=93217 RepID=UPI001F5E1FB2|nr:MULTISPECIES: helix-turn-helix transcriptional regulator [Pandoraea]MCI3207975.1 AraC family transcriptional regulator [Pandoraea sp. LA3]MDN4586004.1 AraC family transcriptional regulator [Pandoraea capi]